MGIVSRGFGGRRRGGDEKLPPGQYLVTDFPVLSAGPTPRVNLDSWELRIRTETGPSRSWDWAAFQALPHEDITVDLHCVTKWSKLGTTWRGVSLDTLRQRGPRARAWRPGPAARTAPVPVEVREVGPGHRPASG